MSLPNQIDPSTTLFDGISMSERTTHLRSYVPCLLNQPLLLLFNTSTGMTLTTVSTRTPRASTLVTACVILLTLQFHVCLGHRVLDRGQNIADTIHGELREDATCRSFGFGPNCTAHEECTGCVLKFPHWEFCVSNKTASHLPKCMYVYYSMDWGCVCYYIGIIIVMQFCSTVLMVLILPLQSHMLAAMICLKRNVSWMRRSVRGVRRWLWHQSAIQRKRLSICQLQFSSVPQRERLVLLLYCQNIM